MSSLEDLGRQLQLLEKDIGRCVRCGACQSVCPLFHETRHEADVARGKMALIEGIRNAMFENTKGAAERINRCLLCGSCATVCTSGLPVVEMFLRARVILAGYQNLPVYKKIVFRTILARPRTLSLLLRWLRTVQPVFTRPVENGNAESCGRALIRGVTRRRMPLLPRRSFHESLGAGLNQNGRTSVRVAFFTGCLINHVFPDVAEAAVAVLQKHGMGIYIPAEQVCCGMPAFAGGDMDALRRVMRQNLDLFDPAAYDVLVTACATCTAAIRKFWPIASNGEPAAMREKIRTIAERTMDIHEFMVQSGLKAPALHGPSPVRRVTYHDPCHLKKTLGIAQAPRQMLKAIQGVEFMEMNEADVCCGMGGSFNLSHYDLSTAIGRRKTANIAASGADIVTTACPACMLQLRDVLSQAGSSVNVRHVIELYAEGLMGDER